MKSTLYTNTFLTGVLSLLLLLAASCGEDDVCGRDADCKGERICDAGQCVAEASNDGSTNNRQGENAKNDKQGENATNDDPAKNNPNSRQGYVECGDKSCQPGTFCRQIDFVTECKPGCVSKENCSEAESCKSVETKIDAFGEYEVGSCKEPRQMMEPEPMMENDFISDCKDACQLANVICGDANIISPTDVAGCNGSCDTISRSEREQLIACVEAAAASFQPCNAAGCFP